MIRTIYLNWNFHSARVEFLFTPEAVLKTFPMKYRKYLALKNKNPNRSKAHQTVGKTQSKTQTVFACT